MLSDFAKADQDWLDDLLRGVSDGAVALAAGEDDRFGTAVAARTAPARNSGTRGPSSVATPKGEPPLAAQVTAEPSDPPSDFAGKLRALGARFGGKS